MKNHKQPRDSEGRFGGRGAYEAKAPAPSLLFTPIADATDRLRSGLEAALTDLSEVEPAAKGAPVPTSVLAASPGSGKSRMCRELLAERLAGEAVAFHVPTLALAEEAAANAAALETPAQLVRGRTAKVPGQGDETMCAKAELVARGSKLGLSIYESFCQRSDDPENRCEFFEACKYLRQFNTAGTATHRYMATRYLAFPETGEFEPTLRVVDETFWAQQISIVEIPVAEFTMPRTFLRLHGRNGQKHAKLAGRQADLLTAARALVDILGEGRSPLELSYSAEDYAEFASLEHRSHGPAPQLFPGQSSSQQLEALELAERNVRYTSWFAAVWTCLAHAKEIGRSTTERLRLVPGREGASLRLCRRRPLPHREPTLVLDADADAEILAAVGCDVRQTSNMILRPNAEVVQIHDRRMTLGSLKKGNALRKDWRRVIAREVLMDRVGQGGGVLIGASRKVVLEFFRDDGHDFSGKSDAEVSKIMLGTKLHGASWIWFGSRALGSNAYEDFGTVVIIGREELPTEILEDYGRALWGDRPDADLEFLEPDANNAVRMPDLEVPYLMADGSAQAVDVACHPDPLIRRIQLQTRELATRQLVERLRLARAERPKRVVLGCNIPIPGLPVDRLATWEEFKPRRHEAALAAAILGKGGMRLSAKGLHEDVPTVFEKPDAAKSYLKRNRTRVSDFLRGLPGTVTRQIHHIELCKKRPYERPCEALVFAPSEADALRIAEAHWGPLKFARVQHVRRWLRA